VPKKETKKRKYKIEVKYRAIIGHYDLWSDAELPKNSKIQKYENTKIQKYKK